MVNNNKLRFYIITTYYCSRLLPIPYNTGSALLANLPVRLNLLVAAAADFQNERKRQTPLRHTRTTTSTPPVGTAVQ